MKRLFLICIVLTIYLLQVHVALANPTNGGNSVSWDYWSPLEVTETINSIGGGLYRYSYNLVNTDWAPIWHFGIYTTFTTQGSTGGTPFNDDISWGGPEWRYNNELSPEYVGTNLDSAIMGITNTYTLAWMNEDRAIHVGDAALGYSFVASTYDPLPKYYYYETIPSGCAASNSRGNVAAVGLTVVIPAPSAILLGTIGICLIGWLRRRRTL